MNSSDESFPASKKQRTETTAPGTECATLVRDIDPLKVSLWSSRTMCLIEKMREFNVINAQTPPWLVAQLAKIADKLCVYGRFGKLGNGVALLKHIGVGHPLVDPILFTDDYKSLLSNCTEQCARQKKEILWLVYSAFLICFFEVRTKKQFTIQYYHPRTLVLQFLAFYPGFAKFNGLLISRLLTFHLCMQIAVSAFELSVKVKSDNSESVAESESEIDSDAQRIIELVVRMTEGPELAHAAFKADVASDEMMTLGAAPPKVIRECRKEIFDKILKVKRTARAQKEQKNEKQAAGGSNISASA